MLFGILSCMDTEHEEGKLEAEKTKLEGEMRSIGRPNVAVPGDWEPLPNEADPEPDPVDQAEVVTSREEDASILADLEARYTHVCEALARIEARTYGVCEVCSKPIESARLAGGPAAPACAEP